MTLDTQLNTLMMELDNQRIDFKALQRDVQSGNALFNLSLLSVNFPPLYDLKVVQWALQKHQIPRQYSLTTTRGGKKKARVVGHLDLTLDHTLSDEDSESVSYGLIFEKLEKRHESLNEESRYVLLHCERQGGSPLDTIALLARKKRNGSVPKRGERVYVDGNHVMSAYLIERFGFRDGDFHVGTIGVYGDIPQRFVSEGYPVYAVAPAIFGKTTQDTDHVYLFVEGRKKRTARCSFSDADGLAVISNKAAAVRVLRTLRGYRI